MTEDKQKQLVESLLAFAVTRAAEAGVPMDRIAATALEAGCTLLQREVGPLGAAEVLRQMSARTDGAIEGQDAGNLH